MSVVGTGDLVEDAVRRSGAVLAVNVITLEHAEAIVAAATVAGRGLILQVSENAVAYHHGSPEPIIAAVHALAELAPVPLAVHLDHLTDEALVERVLRPPSSELVSSLMYDAGALPYAENLERTGAIARRAHDRGLWVEAELGFVGGKGGVARNAHESGVRTDPTEAAEFVAATGVDALAVAVGSSHAMTEQTARIDTDLVRSIATAVPVPLVLHGSSGVPDDELRGAVAAGIRKVNVGTALNKAMTSAVRSSLAADERVTDPRRWLDPAREAMTASVAHLLEVLR